MIIIDDALPKTVFNSLVSIVTDWSNFPLYFIPNTAYDKTNKDYMDFSFFHLFVDNGTPTSSMSNYPLAAVHSCIDLTEYELDYVERIRLGMIVSDNSDYQSEAHVDTDSPHKTGLLYLNESDGDTIFYDKKYDPKSGMSPIEYGRLETLAETKRVSPKPNRLVIFDGHTYHASSKPIKNAYRLVLNFNFMVKE